MTSSLLAAAFVCNGLLFLVFSILVLFLERKFIAIAQRRLGISFLGRNGWAHLPADLCKFWLKYSGQHRGAWNIRGLASTAIIFGFFSWSTLGLFFFLSDNHSSVVDMWDFQLPAYLAYATLTTLYMFHVIAGLKSKYATLACARLALLSIMMEIFFAACFLFCYAVYGGYSLDTFADSATSLGPLATALPPLGAFFFLYALFEAKRAPFDHTEAESELVAGHMVEFAGRSLLFFYLAEYAHFFFCLFLVSCLCFSYGPAWGFACSWAYAFDLISEALWL